MCRVTIKSGSFQRERSEHHTMWILSVPFARHASSMQHASLAHSSCTPLSGPWTVAACKCAHHDLFVASRRVPIDVVTRASLAPGKVTCQHENHSTMHNPFPESRNIPTTTTLCTCCLSKCVHVLLRGSGCKAQSIAVLSRAVLQCAGQLGSAKPC